MSVRFWPKKPMPLPPCARRACVSISSSLLIYMVLLIVLRVIAMTCRIMLTVVLLYARQNVCVLYNKLLNLGVVVGVALLIWPEVWFYGIQMFMYYSLFDMVARSFSWSEAELFCVSFLSALWYTIVLR